MVLCLTLVSCLVATLSLLSFSLNFLLLLPLLTGGAGKGSTVLDFSFTALAVKSLQYLRAK